MAIRFLDSLSVSGQRVFIRLDLNVPYSPDGKIVDDTRIRETLPSIRALQEKKGRLILASHLGRPKGRDSTLSLLPVGERLTELLGNEVIFPEDCVGDAVRKLAHDLKEGQVMLLENLRFHPGEEANDPEFAKKLSLLADVYVSDAFGTVHRAHASTVGMVSHFSQRAAGLLIQKELEMLGKCLHQPKRPFFAILGGAKVSDKIGVIENLMSRVEGLLLGGALANTFLAAKGIPVGRSKCEVEKIPIAQKILKRAEERGVSIYLPQDFKVVEALDWEKPRQAAQVEKVSEDQMIVDIGEKTVTRYGEILSRAATLFWNGPMGIFEISEYATGTFGIARAIARPEITTVIGGGESVTAIRQSGLAEKITHLSTGGGAALEYLEGKVLPGLKVLEV